MVGEALIPKSSMLVQELDTLNIECLPAKIPTQLEVDLSSFTEQGQAVRVKDIKLDRDIIVLNDPELVVARVITRPVEKVVAEVAAEEAVETTEAASPRGEESKEQ